ncbi:hypothetical protein C4N9_20915 [Pararhodobacter marinus]|uniref:Uncharacterized protein n=1 Tax=Pararhodobacter marinus TaxID=2184063 RepID=A0A2U2C4C7_9RHOB|nr:hypothetical protein [Pararhodobacter marinus]PWE26723.1 hypothetical protein C4N9_20915 [Pararhodobacter marinus]
MATKNTSVSLQIDALKQGRVTLKMIGTTGLYFNAMSAKAKRTLLIGGGKKTAAEKRELKHDPQTEYRDSVYRLPDGPTLLGFPAPGVKGAMATAALETPGVTKSSVQRLIFLPEQKIKVWGRPYLKCDVVRSADMARTPDVRTRAFLPRWCAEVDIAFITPTLSIHSIISLLSNAGVIVGIGDFRQEKGRGSYGTFAVATEDLGDWQETWDDITAEGRDVQEDALANPAAADDDTAELLAMLEEERIRRAA